MKRFLALAVALIMMLGIMSISVSAATPVLKFNSNGKFRIMHITDTHYTDFPFEESIMFMSLALDEFKPDLVVFGGDNIKGNFDTATPYGVKSAITQMVDPVVARRIPFTFVFGNHDQEAILCSKSKQYDYYKKHSLCIAPNGYSDSSRKANGNILVKDSTGKKNILNIWLFDSGTKTKMLGKTTIDNVTSKQLDWYTKQAATLKKNNGGKVIPSIVFQHIPIAEVSKICTQNANGVSIDGKKYVLKSGITDGIQNGVTGMPNNRITTHLNKTVEVPTKNSGEYSKWVKTGDVFAAFFGHSHINDYCGITSDNIILGGTNSAGGFNITARISTANGDIEARGLRIIDIDQKTLMDSSKKNTAAVTTFSVYMSDYISGTVQSYPKKVKDKDDHSVGEWIKIVGNYAVHRIW